jgi:hypothetical protein
MSFLSGTPDVFLSEKFAVFDLPALCDRRLPDGFSWLRTSKKCLCQVPIACRVSGVDLKPHTLRFYQEARRARLDELELHTRFEAVEAFLGCYRHASRQIERSGRRCRRGILAFGRRDLRFIATPENNATQQEENTRFHTTLRILQIQFSELHGGGKCPSRPFGSAHSQVGITMAVALGSFGVVEAVVPTA